MLFEFALPSKIENVKCVKVCVYVEGGWCSTVNAVGCINHRDNQTKQMDSINFLGHLKTLLEQYTIIIANLVHTCIEQSKD